MYSQDSFHTLTGVQQIGLGTLSLLLFSLCFYICFQFTKSRSLPINLVIFCTIFFLYVWLSPQIYYMYYMLIFDSLPMQIVIHAPPTPWSLIKLLSFQEKASLSNHSKAILGWVLIAVINIQRKTQTLS